MAKVYASPLPAPEWEQYEVAGRFSIDKMHDVDSAYIESVAAWLRANGYKHRLTGEVIHFPIADGYAQYMIANGQVIIHLPLGDAWQIPDSHARGLRATDLAEQVKRQRSLAALFSGKGAST